VNNLGRPSERTKSSAKRDFVREWAVLGSNQ
jgi:hypothetical protein